MENENLLTAYHESARVVFTYLNGYLCDLMELPGNGSATSSKLNAGNDGVVIQAILSGKPSAENPEHSIEVAGKLMSIYCAGTCAKIFFENNQKIPDELELDISGQDLAMIEKIQSFLKKSVADHPNDFPSRTIISVFKKLKDPEVWKAVELLATKALQQSALKRFYIEDTLMMAGIKMQRATTKSGFGVGLHEDDSTGPTTAEETKVATFEPADITPLDIMLREFLKKIKSNWQEDELNGAIAYLNNIYKKYG